MATAASKKKELKDAALADVYFFAKLITPTRQYSDVHKKMFRFLSDNRTDCLALIPRAHAKSWTMAVWAAWWITKHPEATIAYVSATEDLAIQQLYMIKNFLISDVYRRYWPEMVVEEEGQREEWNARNIRIDHPYRKKLGVRDRTVAARSIGSNTTGMHCDVLLLDDIVIPDNAYSEEGRRKVQSSYSQFSSILNPNGVTKVVGTRYHGKDIYGILKNARLEKIDKDGNITGDEPMFRVMEKAVEEEGIYLWPREKHPATNKWYGFNDSVLNKIKAKYYAAGERAQFFGQYYNNPESSDEDRITSNNFQYYDRKDVSIDGATVKIKNKNLAVFAAADLAFTDSSTSDFTAIAVVGLDESGFLYILDLDQFKTSKYERIYQSVERMHKKWNFRKIRIETNAGANLVAEYMKDRVREEGLSLSIEGKNARGEKVERHQMILEPKYENHSVFHFQGGWISQYEDQLMLARPAHDDLIDAVAAAVEISRVPKKRRATEWSRGNVIGIDSRFGGRVL